MKALREWLARLLAPWIFAEVKRQVSHAVEATNAGAEHVTLTERKLTLINNRFAFVVGLLRRSDHPSCRLILDRLGAEMRKEPMLEGFNGPTLP